jgi:hypothetical protein
MTTMSGALYYLYGFVPAGAEPPPPELRGVEGAPVSLLTGDGVSAIVGEVPEAEYGGGRLDDRLGDLGWVGERGLAHDRVLSWFADRGAVVPVAPFSLHGTEEGVRRLLTERADELSSVLDRLGGRREWGIRVWRTAETTPRVEARAPELVRLRSEMAGAPAGRRFLMHKKLESAVREALRAAYARIAREALDTLRPAAEASRVRPVPPAGEATRSILLDAVFLVPVAGFDAFAQRVRELAASAGRDGFEVEFTGPWPPYHFVGDDG